VVTAGAILVTNMFEGVLIGLLLAVVKTAWETSHVHIDVDESGTGAVRVRIRGHATFLRLPHILDTLERLPGDRPVELDLAGLRHLDHACMSAMQNWADQHNAHTVQPEHTRARA
jgi:MFS superfamily sulfate permease-like transporter